MIKCVLPCVLNNANPKLIPVRNEGKMCLFQNNKLYL